MPGKTICSLVAAVILTLFGCKEQKQYQVNHPRDVVTGKPISVTAGISSYGSGLSVMIQNRDGELVLCNSSKYGWKAKKVIETKTIIQSEIEDNDDEPITVKGRYTHKGKKFEFTYVFANKYHIEVKPENCPKMNCFDGPGISR